jgi:hypothetical protein
MCAKIALSPRMERPHSERSESDLSFLSTNSLVGDVETLSFIDCSPVYDRFPLPTARIGIEETDVVIFGKIVVLVVGTGVAAISTQSGCPLWKSRCRSISSAIVLGTAEIDTFKAWVRRDTNKLDCSNGRVEINPVASSIVRSPEPAVIPDVPTLAVKGRYCMLIWMHHVSRVRIGQIVPGGTGPMDVVRTPYIDPRHDQPGRIRRRLQILVVKTLTSKKPVRRLNWAPAIAPVARFHQTEVVVRRLG